MLTATKDLMLPTTVTGSWPRPKWYTGNLLERPYSTEIAEAVKGAGRPDLDRRRIELPGHIKSLGQYQISVRLHPEVTAKFALSVVAAK